MTEAELREFVVNNALQCAEAQHALVQAYWEGVEKQKREHRIEMIKLIIGGVLCYVVLIFLFVFGISLMLPD